MRHLLHHPRHHPRAWRSWKPPAPSTAPIVAAGSSRRSGWRLDPTQNTNFHTVSVRDKGATATRTALPLEKTTVPLDVMQPLALRPFDQVLSAAPGALCTDSAPSAIARTTACRNGCRNCSSHDLNGSLTGVYQRHYDLIYSNMPVVHPTALPYRATPTRAWRHGGLPALLPR